ncbi:hypothetical protein K438DRAFT_1779813 [Mycena galopus ATCC 62051]|nr:hypothetical protein K438DRAFT_1779813 [Mycena galopus ATCC 62051]
MPIPRHIIPKETLQVLEIQTKCTGTYSQSRFFPNLALVVINMDGFKAVPRVIPTLSTIAPRQRIRTIIIRMGSHEYGPDFRTEWAQVDSMPASRPDSLRNVEYQDTFDKRARNASQDGFQKTWLILGSDSYCGSSSWKAMTIAAAQCPLKTNLSDLVGTEMNGIAQGAHLDYPHHWRKVFGLLRIVADK